MLVQLDETHDPKHRSWVESANTPGANFPIQNLPFAAFRMAGAEDVRCGVAIGEQILDVGACAEAFDGAARIAAEACREPVLNDLMALGAGPRSALRRALSSLLGQGNEAGRGRLAAHLHALDKVELVPTVRLTAFTDFFASIEHATNAGSLFRPDEPLFPNYKYVPIGYNGRVSSIIPSGTEVVRPRGQTLRRGEPEPSYRASDQLDYEVELAIHVGQASQLGTTIPIANAWDHIFGVSLLNDWSARDIQSWEYRPLGPFLGKSFATTLSPIVVTTEALAPFRVPARQRAEGDPAPLPYLACPADASAGGVDIQLDCLISSTLMRAQGTPAVRVGAGSSRELYWTFAQMVTHHASNGCSLQVGDLMGTGTVSGAARDSYGSLLEVTRRGDTPLVLPGGETRAFLEDGDEVTITGRCRREGFVSIGFGSCVGRVVPASEA